MTKLHARPAAPCITLDQSATHLPTLYSVYCIDPNVRTTPGSSVIQRQRRDSHRLVLVQTQSTEYSKEVAMREFSPKL